MNLTNTEMPIWLKQVLAIGGLLLALSGLPALFGFFCLALLLILSDDSEAITVGLVSFTVMVITVGAGGATFWHGLRSLQRRVSKPLHLPPVWTLLGIFLICIPTGLFIVENGIAAGLFFPPTLLLTGALPPVLAMSWFAGRGSGELTWRRGIVALAGGMTVSMALAVMLETLFAATLLTLVFDLANSIANNIGTLSQALMGKNITGAVATSGFVFIFIQITIVAPVVEELAKPLVTLPVIGRLSSSGAFLMGAMAGAGFAMLENIVYAGLGFSFWAGILLIRGIGAAIHPLGSGLVAQGWRDVLRREKNAGARWFARFGLATGIHLLWNLSSLLLIMLVGAQFFNELPRGINVLGLLAAGTILVLLIGLGIATLWIGRAISQKKFQSAAFIKPEKLEVSFIFSDRAVAIWAVVCLVATIPVGIIGWQLLIR